VKLLMKRDSVISGFDDDESVRESPECLLKSLGFQVSVFAGTERLLSTATVDETDCLILCVHLGGERTRIAKDFAP